MAVFLLQLLFSLHHYDGDDRIKDFIFDLVSSTVDQEKDYRNHTGASAVIERLVECSLLHFVV